jgi:23S rRNA (guanosine2251-2'-O)-methyltransferase
MRKLQNNELDRLTPAEMRLADKNPIAIVLDNIRSMHNVGSAFRTADAFLCQQVYLCGITACPPHREIHKTALGATDSVAWQYLEHTTDAVEMLKAEDYKIVCVEQADESIPLQHFGVGSDEKLALIFGNEVRGVLDEVVQMADVVVEIPQFGTKHSLNVSVSIGVVVWDVFNKLNSIK